MSVSTGPSSLKRAVLITGCSQHGLGYALAVAFHNAGFRVFATARNPERMVGLKELGIETLKLDVCDADSIRECVEAVRGLTKRDPSRTNEDSDVGGEGRLDCLVNNAGGGRHFSSFMDYFSLFASVLDCICPCAESVASVSQSTRDIRDGADLCLSVLSFFPLRHPIPATTTDLPPSRLQHARLRHIHPRGESAVRP